MSDKRLIEIENALSALRHGLASAIARYFRVKVDGLENIPTNGKGLIVPNHSGFAAADAVMICHLVHRELDRVPHILAHRAFFELFGLLRQVSTRFGLDQVSVDAGVELLSRGELVLLFPEGEGGNFKPSTQRYHLQHFHTGFIRMALRTAAPIVPCLVIGAEESHFNLGSIDLTHYMKGLRLPLPLNLVPLPARWKIRFLQPLKLEGYGPEAAEDHELVTELTRGFQIDLQRELNHELARRKKVY